MKSMCSRIDGDHSVLYRKIDKEVHFYSRGNFPGISHHDYPSGSSNQL